MKRMKTRRGTAAVAVAIAAAMVLAACSSGGGTAQSGSTDGASTAPTGSDGASTAPTGSDGASTSESASEGTPIPGGELVMARNAEPQSLLPSVPTDNSAIWVIEELFDTLVVPSQDGSKVEPSLATSWKQSDDKLSWTFDLRKDVEFTNGQPLTSADVKFSIEQNQTEDAAWSYIDNVITKMDTPDEHTIVFHTKQPWAPLPADLGLFANSVVPNNYAGMSAKDFTEKPIGSGPFKLDSWEHGSSLTIVKNDKYWKKDQPYLDSVKFTLAPDANTRSTQLASGQIQINEFPAKSSIKSLENQPNVTVTDFPSSRVNYLALNNGQKPLDDVNVRKAIGMAINKKAMIDAVDFGHGEPAGAYLSPATWAHNADIKTDTFDLAGAKAAMAKSSVPDGFTTSISIGAGSAGGAAKAQLVQGDLAKIGIKLEIKQLDSAARIAEVNAELFDMRFAYYTTDVVDPDEMARFAGTYDGGTKTVRTQFKNAEMDKLADEASGSSDQAKRKVAYDKMQQIIADNVPYVTLSYGPATYSYSNKVHGFHPGATGNYFLENVWLSK